MAITSKTSKSAMKERPCLEGKIKSRLWLSVTLLSRGILRVIQFSHRVARKELSTTKFSLVDGYTLYEVLQRCVNGFRASRSGLAFVR